MNRPLALLGLATSGIGAVATFDLWVGHWSPIVAVEIARAAGPSILVLGLVAIGTAILRERRLPPAARQRIGEGMLGLGGLLALLSFLPFLASRGDEGILPALSVIVVGMPGLCLIAASVPVLISARREPRR